MRLFAGTAARLVPPQAVPHGALEQMLGANAVSSVFVSENVARYRAAGSRRTAPVVGITSGGRGLPGRRPEAVKLRGACWVGTNVVPVSLDDDGIRLVADHLLATRTPRSSFFGPRREVLGVWEALKDRWPQPFAVRDDQPLLVFEGSGRVDPHPGLRHAEIAEIAEVLPASAAMFQEEVGYSPYVEGDNSYVRRVSRLIHEQRTFVVMRDGRVVFKADVGAAAGDICQIQGVWVAPDFRGRGLAVPCMAAVVEQAQRRWPTVSLYVNSYNLPALKTYHRVGFRQTGTFATVLF